MEMSAKHGEYCSYFKTRFIYFAQNSDIHGFRRVAHAKNNNLKRWFWVSVLLVSSGCLYLLLEHVFEFDDEINFTPDTLYLRWQTTFPAVTVCANYNPKTAQKKLTAAYADLMGNLSYDYRRYLTDLLYARGTCKSNDKSPCKPCGELISCDLPWRTIIDKVRRKCHELIRNCTYNGHHFECCKEFYEVDSEYGNCFSFNTLQHKNPRKPLYRVNTTTGPGVMSFRILFDAQVSVHSTEELSTNNLDTKFKFEVKSGMENFVEYLFSIVETEDDPMLRYEDITTRGCRYLHEIPDGSLHTYPVYSYNACRLTLNTLQSFKRCDCIHPVRDLSYKGNYCNYTGLNCLVTYEAERKLNKDTDTDESLDCLPSCVESELTKIHISRRWNKETGSGTKVIIRMSGLPTLRYRRNLITTDLDVVVAIGGIVNLFFSASVLSLVEIFYLALRPIY